MNSATPKMRDFAKRLIAYEARGKKSSEKQNPVAFQVCEKLRGQLVLLMGNGGYRALLSHALVLASKKAPGLSTVQVKADGSLEELNELKAQADPQQMVEDGAALLARLLGLLTVFIGENLTVQLVHEVWREIPLNYLDLVKGDKNENTKWNYKSKTAQKWRGKIQESHDKQTPNGSARTG